MWKAVLVMFVATVFVSIGDGLLSKGLRELHKMQFSGTLWSSSISYLGAAVQKPTIVIGVFCHASFFALMLLAFSWGDLSLVLPISAFTYVFGALMAHFYLKEDVNALRWIGAVIILVGVFTVLMGEKKEQGQTSPEASRGALQSVQGPDGPLPDQVRFESHTTHCYKNSRSQNEKA